MPKSTLEPKLHEFVLCNNKAKPFMKIFAWINSIVMSKYNLTIVLSKIEVSWKLAKKGDFRKNVDPFWGFILKTVLGIHDPRISWQPFGAKYHEIRGSPVTVNNALWKLFSKHSRSWWPWIWLRRLLLWIQSGWWIDHDWLQSMDYVYRQSSDVFTKFWPGVGNSIFHGHSWWWLYMAWVSHGNSFYFELALTDKNILVRFECGFEIILCKSS